MGVKLRWFFIVSWEKFVSDIQKQWRLTRHNSYSWALTQEHCTWQGMYNKWLFSWKAALLKNTPSDKHKPPPSHRHIITVVLLERQEETMLSARWLACVAGVVIIASLLHPWDRHWSKTLMNTACRANEPLHNSALQYKHRAYTEPTLIVVLCAEAGLINTSAYKSASVTSSFLKWGLWPCECVEAETKTKSKCPPQH